MTGRRTRHTALLAAGVLSIVMIGTPSLAETGAFQAGQCVADDGAATGCTATSHDQLTGAQGVAVSPDGTSVYVAAPGANALTLFSRARDGALTEQACYENTTANGCQPVVGSTLGGANRVVVSPDGRDVYVTSYTTAAITHFSRAADGTLTFTDCIAASFTTGCTHPSTGSMNTPVGLAISPDGKSLYAVGGGNGVMAYTRATDGSLAEAGCIENGGADGCAAPAHDSLSYPKDVTVSPDGRTVYVVSQYGQAITGFSRGAGGGLTDIGCVGEASSGGCPPPLHESLGDPQAVTVSLDGKNVYVTTGDGNSVTEFSRTANGSLTDFGCLATGGVGGCSDAGSAALSDSTDIVASPDGSSVYDVGGGPGGAVTRLARLRSGRLIVASCYTDDAATGCEVAPHQSLTQSAIAAVSADGASTYVASVGSNSLTGFTTTLAAPDTAIKVDVHHHTAKLTEAASEALATFTCKVDHASYRDCAAHQRFAHLKPGKHTIRAKATNAQGTSDPTPATATFRIKHG